MLSTSHGVGAPRAPNVPTVGDTTKLNQQGARLIGMAQKVVNVGRHCVIAWAGNLGLAQDFVDELRQLMPSDGVWKQSTLDDLCRRHEHRRGFVILGLATGERSVRQCREATRVIGFQHAGADILPATVDGFDQVLLSGAMQAWAPALDALRSMPRQPCLEFAVIQLTGYLLGLEVATEVPLLNRYGGGYEIAALRPDGFQKIDNLVTIVMRGGMRDQEPWVSIPVLITLTKNDGLTTQIVALDLDVETAKVRDASIYLVDDPFVPPPQHPTEGPLLREVWPLFSAWEWISLQLVIEDPAGKEVAGGHRIVLRRGHTDNPITVTGTSDGVVVSIAKELGPVLLESVKRHGSA